MMGEILLRIIVQKANDILLKIENKDKARFWWENEAQKVNAGDYLGVNFSHHSHAGNKHGECICLPPKRPIELLTYDNSIG